MKNIIKIGDTKYVRFTSVVNETTLPAKLIRLNLPQGVKFASQWGIEYVDVPTVLALLTSLHTKGDGVCGKYRRRLGMEASQHIQDNHGRIG